MYSISTEEYVIDYNSFTQYSYQTFSSPYQISASYIGGSMQFDIAVLKISGSELLKNQNLKAVTLAESNDIAVGEPAIAIGNAANLGLSATSGSISVDSENITLQIDERQDPVTIRVLRTDCPVNPGNSGGGLFNKNGELIGIVNAKQASSSIENIGYAIPSSTVKNIVNSIIKYCNGTTQTSPFRCLLGITIEGTNAKLVYNPATLKSSIVEQVKISKITNSSLLVGKIAENTIINSVTINYANGTTLTQSLTRYFELVDLALTFGAGDTVTFHITSPDGQLLPDVSITIDQSNLVLYP